jgi:hypothetical protein
MPETVVAAFYTDRLKSMADENSTDLFAGQSK